jgi:hypothetical protein
VIGVIVVGPGRGESFRVCTAKKVCKTHWAKEQREAKQRTERSGIAAAPTPSKRPQWEIDREREDKLRAEWEAAVPALLDAIATRVAKLPAKANGVLADILVGQLGQLSRGSNKLPVSITRGKTAEDLIRYLAGVLLCDEASHTWSAPRQFPKRAKAIGIDLKKILKGAATKDAPPTAKKAGRV